MREKIGNATIWKPSPTTPLCGIAVTSILSKVLEQNGYDGSLVGLTCGDQVVGEELVGNRGVDMGKMNRTFLCDWAYCLS